MQNLDFAEPKPGNRCCWCSGTEPCLADLLSDPMTVALMAADHVERRDLDNLFDEARGNLRRPAN